MNKTCGTKRERERETERDRERQREERERQRETERDRGRQREERETVCQGETLDTDNLFQTVTYILKKGTVLIQGIGASLNLFEELIPKMKAEAERDRPQYPQQGCRRRHSIGTGRGGWHSGPAPPSPPKLLQQEVQLKNLELDFTEFRELTLPRLTESDTTQPLRCELQQLRQGSQAAMAELRTENQETTTELWPRGDSVGWHRPCVSWRRRAPPLRAQGPYK